MIIVIIVIIKIIVMIIITGSKQMDTDPNKLLKINMTTDR